MDVRRWLLKLEVDGIKIWQKSTLIKKFASICVADLSGYLRNQKNISAWIADK